MINYKQLLVFVTVIRKKSFSKAAKELYMTQPAISWQIKTLENEIDMILIERKERGTKLTEAGKYFFIYAEKIINSHEQLIEEMKQLKHMEKGRLIIGANTVPAEYIIPKYINIFKEKYPLLDIYIKTSTSELIIEQILNEYIHIGIIGRKIEDNRIESIPFKKDKLILVVNSNHPLTKLDKVTFSKIIKYPLILKEKGSDTRKIIEKALNDVDINLYKFPYYSEMSGSISGITAIKNSNSISWVSKVIALDSIKLGDITEIQLENINIERILYLIYYKVKILSSLKKNFIKFLLNNN